jgi:hypothetical protein
VVDSQALGTLYTSPVTLAGFEADAGTTNPATSGWSPTPSSAASAPAPPSASPRPSHARREEDSGEQGWQAEKAAEPKPKAPVVSRQSRVRATGRGGRGR